MAVQSRTQRKENVDLIYGSQAPVTVKRNPYLVDFEEQRGRKQSGQSRQVHTQQRQRSTRPGSGNDGTENVGMTGRSRSRILYEDNSQDRVSRQQAARRAAQARRRKRVLMQRVLVGTWIICILALAATFLFKNGMVSAGEGAGNGSGSVGKEEETPQYSGIMVQGLPAEEYAKHPAWTEDFLTPNEYSRPGDALEQVNSIFVHYTANPGTSASQNRSYFEWLKDTHETSASAHFIIGYEGEIIQCVPLDEIAYAVQSRNFDSISIECCYLKSDGSFTQETYDSLILLLGWLKDAYKLDTEDILRHYDCGGKKCPLYYTENPDAWEELKKDVDKL